MSQRFQGKTAIVTGGGSGIGLSIAERLITEGANVVLNGRDEAKLNEAAQPIGATPSSAYSAANAGVHQLVKNLAIELAPHNIRINAVAPAVVETPVYGTFMTPEQVAETLPSFNAFLPLGRNGQPRDVADAALFLASDEASWITGTVLPVDGGVTAGRH